MSETITVLRTPLGRVHEQRELADGLTIGEILDDIEWDIRLDHYTRFVVDGVEIERARWDEYLPAPGSHKLVHWLPGGDSAKTVLGAVAMIAISIFAPYAATAMGLVAGTFAHAAVAVGITLVGALVVGALFRPPSPRVAGPAAADSVPSPFFTGQSNQAHPYGCIPRIYGTVRVYPNVCAVPYTQNYGSANWLYGLWDFGYGPLAVSDVRVGGTPISTYAGASYSVVPSWIKGQAIPLYANDNALEPVGITLDFIGQTGTRVPTQDSNQVVLEFASPAFVIGTTDGGQYGPYVIFAVTVNGAPADIYYASASTGAIIVEYTGLSSGYFFVHPTWRGDGYNAYQNQFQFSVFINSPTPNPTITVTRVDEHPRDYPLYAANVSWTALRSIRWAAPIAYTAPHTILAAQFLASDQLTGNVDTISALCTSILPVRVGNAWVNQPTNNPAWIYLDILKGSATNRPVTDADIQIADFVTWATECANRGFKCGLQWSWFATVNEALQTVAACGRAAPSMRDGKHTIIMDFAGRVPVQTITPRNSFGLSARMNYIDMPHGLKVKYLDELTWLEDEVTVYDDGRNAATSTLFEELRLVGITNRDQAWMFGRYYIAEGKLRRERVTVSMDVENLVAQRGDLVALVSDVMKVGGRASRVIALDGLGPGALILTETDDALVTEDGEALVTDGESADGGVTITLQSPLAIVPTALRYRNPNMMGLSAVIPIVSSGDIDDNRVTVPAGTAIALDALVVLGTSSVTTGDYLVERILPGRDLTATLELIEHRPEIYLADDGPIPPRVPKPGIPDTGGTLTVTGRLVPMIVAGRRTYEAVLEWKGPATAVSYQVHGVDTNVLGNVDATSRGNGLRYRFRAPAAAGSIAYTVSAYNINGVASATGQTTLVYDPALDDWPPPPPPGNVAVVSRLTDLLLSWKEPDYDFIEEYLVRVDDWDAPVAEYRIKGDHIALPAMRAGVHTFYVATVDPQGDVSEDHPSATYTVLVPLQVALAGTAVGNTAFLRWGSLALGDPLWSAATSFNIEYYELAKAAPGPAPLAGGFAAARALKKPRDPIPEIHRWPEGANLAMHRRKRATSLLSGGGSVSTLDEPLEGPILTESGDNLATEFGTHINTEAPLPPGEYRPIGRSATEFSMLDEQQAGDWVYAVRAVDIAGNLAPWATITLHLQAPDNFFMLDQLEDVIPDGGTFEDAIQMWASPDWLMPVRDHTWEEHYADESWTAPQDQVLAGFPVYAQPGAAALGKMIWEHDYEVVMPTVRVTATAVYSTLSGAPVVTPLFYVKADAGDPWTLVGPADGSLIVPSGNQFIKIEVEVTSAPGRTGLILLHAVSYLLSVQYFTDQGIATTDASGEATVDFTYDYNDVRTVQLTSGNEDIKFVRYEIAPDQDSMTIYATDETLAPQSGDVAWLVRGF